MHTPSLDAAIQDILTRAAPKMFTELGNEDAPILSALDTKSVSGRSHRIRLKHGENRSFGFIADGADLPTARGTQYDETYVSGKIFFGHVKVNRGAVLTANGNGEQTADIIEEELDSALRGAKRQLNHAVIFGTSSLHTLVAGDLTAINACTNAVTATISGDIAYHVRRGQSIDLLDSSASNALLRRFNVVSRTIDNKTPTNNSVVLSCDEATALSAGTAAAAGDYFVIAGAQDGATVDGITGLTDVLSATSTLYDLAPATVPGWAGNEMDNGAAALSETLLNSLRAQVKNRCGNRATKNFWLMNSNRQQEIYELKSDKANFYDTKIEVGDYEAVSRCTGNPIVVDESMPDNEVDLINRDDVKILEWAPMFTEHDGKQGTGKTTAPLFFVSQTDFTYSAQVTGVYNVGASARHSHGRIHNLA